MIFLLEHPMGGYSTNRNFDCTTDNPSDARHFRSWKKAEVARKGMQHPLEWAVVGFKLEKQ